MTADTTRSDGGRERLVDVTGRTPWDVLAILVGKLGVPLLVLFAIGAAVYFFVQQQNDARRDVDQARLEATKAAEAALEAAREKLITTYDKLGTLSEQQIGNIQKVLTLNQQVTQDLEAQRNKLDQLQDQITTSQSELGAAKQEVARLNEEQTQAKAALEAARVELAARQVDLDKRAKDADRLAAQLAEKERQLAAQQARIDQQLASIGQLKSDVNLLARDVVGSAKSLETAALARRVVEEKASDTLLAAAEAPAPNTLDRLQRLIGTPVADFETGLRSEKHGFQTWLRASEPGDESQIFIGLGAPDANNAKLSRMLSVDTDGKLISSIGALVSDVVLVRLNSPEQWFGGTDFLVGRTEPSGIIEVLNEFPAADEPTWQVDRILREFSGAVEVTVVHGDRSPEFNVLDAITLKRDYPEIASALAETPDLALAMAMAEREETFDAARLDLRALQASFPEIAEALRAIIEAAIARETNVLAPLVGPPLRAEDAGRVAAFALRAEFDVVDALEVTDLVRAEARAASLRPAAPYQQTSIDDKAPPPEPATADRNRYVDVSLRYLGGEGAGAEAEESTLRFEQSADAPAWRLTSIRARRPPPAATAY